MSRQINLFNPAFLKREQPFSALMMSQALILVIVIGMLFYAYTRYQVSELESHVVAIERELAIEREQMVLKIAEFGKKNESTLLIDELQRLEFRLSRKQVVDEVLEDKAFGNTNGYSEYMRAFARQHLNGLWLTGFTISNVGMILNGRVIQADLLPTYLQRLKREKVMLGRSFSNLQIKVPEPEPEYTESEIPLGTTIDYFEFSLSSSGIKKEK